MKLFYISVLLLFCCDSNSPTSPSSTPSVIVGCGTEGACNYIDDCDICDINLCEFVEDCLGVCGGNAVLDECGECGGNGTSCDDGGI